MSPSRAVQLSAEQWPLLLGCFASAAVLVGTATHAMTWGSQAGNWVYPYLRDFNPQSLLAAAVVFPAALGLAVFASRRIETREASTLLLCVIAGIALQALLRAYAALDSEILLRLYSHFGKPKAQIQLRLLRHAPRKTSA